MGMLGYIWPKSCEPPAIHVTEGPHYEGASVAYAIHVLCYFTYSHIK